MCGILLSYSIDNEHLLNSDCWSSLVDEVNKRGPDFNKSVDQSFGGETLLKFHSSVLSMRLPFHEQPCIDPNNERVLQYNGEIYNTEVSFKNDTEYVFSEFAKYGVIEAVQRFRGEYAFTYVERDANDPLKRYLWFARDCIGRRSLLYSIDNWSISICSVAPMEETLGLSSWKEVPAGTLFRLDLSTMDLAEYHWSHSPESGKLGYPYGRVEAHLDYNVSDTNERRLTNELSEILECSVKKRLQNIPLVDSSDEAHVAILFSGGLDCTLLALMADRVLPSNAQVDLLNVSFENPRTGNGYSTPDRLLSRRSWNELAQVCNEGRFRLVEIDVPYTETLESRQRVQKLMYPKNTVMDLSIALAFYFASRGKGRLFVSPDETEPACLDYLSRAKVLISGLGADELFGGYTRHTNQLRRSGYENLSKELQLDFDRLHERNLGRDDRVCACWGKELRYPFLDEHLVRWAVKLPLQYKVSGDKKLNIPGEDDILTKCILRHLSRANNLPLVSNEKKRAIQFGAKSAKMEMGQSKVKGQDLLEPSTR